MRTKTITSETLTKADTQEEFNCFHGTVKQEISQLIKGETTALEIRRD